MSELKPNIKKWLKALRSGKYNQVEGTLKEVDEEGNTIGFCCLGVYRQAVSRKKVEGCVREEGLEYDYIDEGTEDVYKSLRSTLGDKIVDTGISMNDKGKSFTEIADEIESMYKNGEV